MSNSKYSFVKMTMYRKQKNLTQYELAAIVGVTQAEISLLERQKIVGTRVPDLLAKIAKVLGCREAELMETLG